MRIATKISVLLIIVIVAATLGITWFVYRANTRVLERRLTAELKREAAQTVRALDRFLYERCGDIEILATAPVICSPSSSAREMTERLIRFRNFHKSYISLAVFDLDRRTIADSAGLTVGEQHPLDRYWPELIQDGIYTGRRVYTSWSLGIPVIHFAAAVKDAGGNVFRYVVSRIPPGKLHELTASIGGYLGSTVELTQRDGLLIYSSKNRKGILKDNLRNTEYFKRGIAGKDDDIGVYICGVPGKKEIIVSARLRGYLDFKGDDWALFIRVPAEEVFKPAIQLRKKMVFILVLTVLFSAMIAAVFALTITRPLQRLREFAVRAGEGDLDDKIVYTKKDEIGDVARALNDMAEKLKNTQDALCLANQSLSAIFSSAATGIITIGLDRVVRTWNVFAEKIFGWKAEEVVGRVLSYVPDDKMQEHLDLLEGLRKGSPLPTVETERLRKDGTRIPVSLCISPLIDIRGQMDGYVGILMDITERKRAEEALRKAYEELEEMHDQLTQSEKLAVAGRLAAGAAHEINNPLAYMMGNLSVLKGYRESIEQFFKAVPFDSLPAVKKKEILALQEQLKIPDLLADLPGLIGETHEGAERIRNIVQGLILFTAKESGTREPLDLNECLAQALDTLSSRLRGKVHVVREWAKVPPVEGSRADIVHALTNVLLNAAEAIGKEGMITVRTGGERENAVVEVSDTGCGIPPDALSKIFEPFFTTKESRKGIGLGMAIVHGIIKRHNGTIDVQSAVGKGTTVIITLPAKMGTVPIF